MELPTKIRVLEILATLKRAGAETMAVSLARRLDSGRFECGVVSLYDAFPGGLDPDLQTAGVPLWHLGKRPGLDLRMIPRLRRVFREFRPAILHTHSYVLRYTIPAALRLPGLSMVHTVHNLAPREHDSAGRLIQRLAFNHRVNAVAVGEVVRLSFRAYYCREPETAIRNGIDIAAFRRPEARLPWRKAHGFSEEDFLIASVGRLDPQKNPLALIDAFASAFTATPAAHLLLAGDGTLREAARQRAASHGLAARVHFLGVQTETAALLNAADLFALASDWEGTPLAVMEAMATGLPVVATCVGGVPELVHHNEAGLLVSRGDTAAFAQSLARLAADPGLRAAMSAAAFDNARRFDIRTMVAAYAALFERLAGGRA